jgi:hypothetical protein
VTSFANAGSWAKAGIMIRESLGAGSPHAYALLSAGHGYAFQRRAVAGGTSLNTAGALNAAPGWVRLTRSGSLLTAYQSSDGTTWTAVGADSVPMASTVYVGIAVTSHNATAATTITADSLRITQAGGNQPPTVSITSPANGATFTAPASMTITANAADPEKQLTKVEFYNGAVLLGTATTAPYSVNWSSVPGGTYSLTAKAYDAAGASTRSAAVSVTVGTTTSSTVPSTVVFTASINHADVTSYRLEAFPATADTTTATPLSTFDAGKPVPDSNNDITVSAAAFFTALAPGNYQLTVSAISAGGFGRSTPVAFTR